MYEIFIKSMAIKKSVSNLLILLDDYIKVNKNYKNPSNWEIISWTYVFSTELKLNDKILFSIQRK